MSEEEYEVEALEVEVSSQPIELYKVLKIANAVSGGGEAKHAIGEGYVAVNGELEQRKRRKLYDGDVIEFNGEFYYVHCEAPVQEEPEQEKPAPKKAAKPNKTSNKKSSSKKEKKAAAPQEEPQRDSQTGRGAIKF